MLRLADELFFIGIDDRTGSRRLSPRVFGLGLAAGLLGELLLDHKLDLSGGNVQPSPGKTPPSDGLAHTTWEQIVAEPRTHPIPTWLAGLSRHAEQQVADRLHRSGHVDIQQVRRWGLGRPTNLYPPTDINTAYWPTARLATHLGSRRQLTWQDAALVGMVAATGLDGYVLYAAEPEAREYMRHILDHLFPHLAELVAQLRIAVGEAVMAGRT